MALCFLASGTNVKRRREGRRALCVGKASVPHIKSARVAIRLIFALPLRPSININISRGSYLCGRGGEKPSLTCHPCHFLTHSPYVHPPRLAKSLASVLLATLMARLYKGLMRAVSFLPRVALVVPQLLKLFLYLKKKDKRKLLGAYDYVWN